MIRSSKLNQLRAYIAAAPKISNAKIAEAIESYMTGKINNFLSLKNAIVALANPSMFGPKKVLDLYQKAMGVAVPTSLAMRLNFSFHAESFALY